MAFSRRGLIAGAAGLLALPAQADTFDYRSHYGFGAWNEPPEADLHAPLDVMLETGDARISLGDWMAGRPAVVALWASWCTPCLVEKAGEALMATRLKKANARVQILIIQAFDNKSLEDGRLLLKRLGAGSLDTARATPEAETAFTSHFGTSSETSKRPLMPSIMIVAADGKELARHAGVLAPPDQRKDYWYDDRTFDFLSRL